MKWCACADELGEMIQHEVKTNPRYKDGPKIFWNNEPPPPPP